MLCSGLPTLSKGWADTQPLYFKVLSSWWIYSHTGQIFLTHASWTHSVLYLLSYGRSLVTWVEFSWHMCLEYILSYASYRDEFLLTRVKFPDSRTSCIFCLVPPTVMSFLLCGSSFSDTHASSTFCLVPPVITGFFLHGLGFLDSHTSDKFYLMLPVVTGFFLRGLGFPDMCTSTTFCLMPLPW